MPRRRVADYIIGQIKRHRKELADYPPDSLDWADRATKTAKRLIPWLVKTGPGHQQFVEDVFNAPAELRATWNRIRTETDVDRKTIKQFDKLLALDNILRTSLTGEIISKVFSKSLIDRFPDRMLKSNGRSDYPDLYLADSDYDNLPQRERGASASYGAALKGRGANKKPVRIPDGLEVKTCKDRIRVDCHHPHIGLHIVLVYSNRTDFVVDDIAVGFLGTSDYRESQRNTTATTVKYSFSDGPFVSLLH